MSNRDSGYYRKHAAESHEIGMHREANECSQMADGLDALTLLRKHEWSGSVWHPGEPVVSCCPECHGIKPGHEDVASAPLCDHRPGCKWKKLLS